MTSRRQLAVTAVMLAIFASSWMRLEVKGSPFSDILLLAALAALPALSLKLSGRLGPRLRSLLLALSFAVSGLLAAAASFKVSPLRLWPRDDQAFFAPLYEQVRRGVLEFYDVSLPFDAATRPDMYGAALFAVFAFTALAGACSVGRRPLAAAAVLIWGVAWPTTLLPSESALLGGGVVLATVLLALYLLKEGGGEGLGTAAALTGTAVVALALVTSGADAVSKPALFDTQSWDLYDAPPAAVGVDYVWDANYGGISFPDKETEVLRVKVHDGLKRALYWRATTLDAYNGFAWLEQTTLGPPSESTEIDLSGQPLLPLKARDERLWAKQEVEVKALRGTRLVVAGMPVRWEPEEGSAYQVAANGALVQTSPLRRGQRYRVWSYAPDVGAAELADAAPATDRRLGRYLDVAGTRFPFWGTPDRFERVGRLFAQGPTLISRDYGELHAETLRVVGLARSPYAATVALDAWFRDEGGFSYVEQPLRGNRGYPPLVAFVLDTKEGYCQHYAGAMALMLRLLGVPARVAVGFTSGDYDEGAKEWVVTDHNAHAWVEVYFPRHGWLPFDPTPGRGELDAQYTSDNFARDFGSLGSLLGSGGALDSIAEREAARAARDSKPGLEGTGASQTSQGSSVVEEHGDSFLKGLLLLASILLAFVWLLKSVRRLARFLSRDPAVLARACRRDLEGYLADQHVSLSESATLKDLAESLRRLSVDAGPLVRALSVARYGPPSERALALRRARRELRQVRRQLKRRLPVRARARGLLSVRSLAV